MATIDFTAAYRDATQGSTLKALAARRAEMQAANAAMKPREVKSPWQGAANIADTISGAIREGRIANDEARGRARFAELLAGGLAPDEIGEAMGLDPDTTMKYQERTWAQEDKTSDRTYTEKQDLLKHGWNVEERTAEVKAAQDAAAEQARVAKESQGREFSHSDAADKIAATNAVDSDLRQAALRADNPVAIDEAIKRGLIPAADGEAMIKQINDKAAAELASKAPDQWTAVTPEIAAQYGPGSPIAKNPGLYHVNTKTNDIELIDPNQFTAAEQEKRSTDTKTKLTTIDVGLDALNRAMELAPEVTEFGAAARPIYDIGGMLPESWTEGTPFKKTADATKRFDQIMKSNAITQMAVQLSGTDSDKDVQRFIEIMADPDSSLTLKRQTISNMINRLQKERLTQADRIKGITGEDYGEYKYANPDAVAGDTAGAGGGTEAPPSEEDIQETMRANNMTREQVMEALAKQKAGGR